MLKIENTEVMGWEHAIRGMRNPKNSWEKSDSGYCDTIGDKFGDVIKPENYRLGPNDFDLMSRLRNAGTDHRKFMRMITVYLDITAPLYWWKEFDTYKVGTVANSCSTMHKIADKEFTLDDFSYEHLNCEPYHRNWIESATVDEDITSPHKVWMTPLDILRCTIEMLNAYRESYLETKDKQDWWQMIQLLPSSYNQKRTVMLNYEVLANMYKSRRNHKLDEWHTFCEWIESLPYSELITGEKKGLKMMKFVVNQLPYYGELCPLWTMCSKNAKEHECPRYWDKYKVCSDENPHECEHLIETEKL